MEQTDYLMISALQHFLYCPRQFALIHVEQHWKDNFFTAQGEVLHKRVDLAGTRRGTRRRVEYALPLGSARLRLAGRADAVEFIHDESEESVHPVEYKRGKSKISDCDKVQLCAQALCLEEMMNCAISEADLFYFETRERLPVALDSQLRSETLKTVEACHALIAKSVTPQAFYDPKRCNACSLFEYCMPKRRGTISATDFLKESLCENS